MSNAWEIHYYHNAAYAAFDSAKTLYDSLNGGLFDRHFEGDTPVQRRSRSGLKHEVAKAASVNCHLAQELFMLIGRDMVGKYPQFVELAIERVALAKDMEDKLKAAELWWREP